MDESCFILGVDLDGVVGDFYASIRKIAAEWLNKQESELTVNVSYELEEWGIAEYGGYERLHRFAVTQRHLFRDMRPMQDAPVVLRKLSSQGVRIRIITHRLYLKYIHKESVIQTVDWLDFWDIPYWDICFMKDKGAVGAHIYVDDAPENIVNLRKQNCKTIVFTNSTNLSLPGLRADSWVDVERLVMEAKAEWEESASP
ncbi:MAG: 5'-nucleotidase [Treponema sp.]|nr:5'-nucleotidase [Treponema sp.]